MLIQPVAVSAEKIQCLFFSFKKQVSQMSVNITKNSDFHQSEELSFTDFKVKILTKNMITV